MRNYIERRRGSEKGFTLIELLVVIVILGILAAVVVFAVSGLSDKGATNACKIDTRTLRTAEEAYYAEPKAGDGTYGDTADLIAKGLIEAPGDKYHTAERVAANPTASPPVEEGYVIKEVGTKCGGTAGDAVDETATPPRH